MELLSIDDRPFGLSKEVIKESKKRQRENVERGVKLLDEKVPNWRERITHPPSMNICHDCIIGQVFGLEPRFNSFLEFEQAVQHDLGIPITDAGKYGFDIGNSDTDSYGDLEDIWQEILSGNSD